MALRLGVHPGFRVAEVGDGSVAYNPQRDVAHWLDGGMARLLALCDGARSRADVLLAFDGNGDGAKAEAWLDEAVKLRLVVEDPTRVGGDPMPPMMLPRAATCLEREGEVRLALALRRRAENAGTGALKGWWSLLEAAQAVGDLDVAKAACRAWIARVPDDAEARHVAAALDGAENVPRAPDGYVRALFGRFAPTYNGCMVDVLGYRGPDVLGEALVRVRGEVSGLRGLDLGCGTGLFAKRARPRCNWLEGIDISPEMLGRARSTKCYDALREAEIEGWLAACNTRFDEIYACDVFCYFGDLRPIARAVARVLAPGGVLALTVEQGDAPVRLTESGRFEHSPAHVREALESAGLRVDLLESRALRQEFDSDVPFLVAISSAPAVRDSDRAGR